MNLELSEEQQLLDDALGRMFQAPTQGQEESGDVDVAALELLRDNGYLDVGFEAGPMEAILVAERAARAVTNAPVTTRVLVGSLMGISDLPLTVGLVGSERGLVRYAGHCDAYLVMKSDDEAQLALAEDVSVEPVESVTGYPLGRVKINKAKSLGPGSGDQLRRAWQVAIGAEIAATSLSAIEFSAIHVRDRYQFGRPIGSMQAVQHQLARAYGMAEAAQWLARRGAWFCDDEFVTASAATFACETAKVTYDACHQVTGAIGITSEYGLVRWTMRLLALQRELGGSRSHSRRVAQARRSALTA